MGNTERVIPLEGVGLFDFLASWPDALEAGLFAALRQVGKLGASPMQPLAPAMELGVSLDT